MKWLKRILVVLLVLIVVVVLVANYFLGSIVKTGVEKLAPSVLGVPVTLGKAEFRLLRGHVRLEDLVVGNPQGFKTPHAFMLGRLTVDLVPSSVFSDKIVIKEIRVEGPEITYEQALKTSNIKKIQENLSSPDAETPKEKAPDAAADEGGKKVQIDHFIVEGGKVKLSTTLALGKSLSVPLPTVELNDIGKESGGTSAKDATIKMFGALSGAVIQAALQSIDLIGKGAKEVGEAALKGAEGVVDTAGKSIDAAKEVGTAVEGAVKDVGGAVGEGASKIVEGLGGLLKKKD